MRLPPGQWWRQAARFERPAEKMPVHDFRSQRLFVDEQLTPAADIACGAAQSNYLRNVLRLAQGAEILVFNGRQGEWRARVEPLGKRACRLIVIDQHRIQTVGPDIVYAFAPLKHARLDYMVQKATEMGVASLQPVMTERTIATRVNTERMRLNVIEAAEQCGVLWVPEVCEPRKFHSWLADWPTERTLIFADEAAEQGAPSATFEGLERGAPIAVLIGPEGGFSDAERALLKSLSCVRTLSLGPRIMRADTAAVAVLTLVNATVGDWST